MKPLLHYNTNESFNSMVMMAILTLAISILGITQQNVILSFAFVPAIFMWIAEYKHFHEISINNEGITKIYRFRKDEEKMLIKNSSEILLINPRSSFIFPNNFKVIIHDKTVGKKLSAHKFTSHQDALKFYYATKESGYDWDVKGTIFKLRIKEADKEKQK